MVSEVICDRGTWLAQGTWCVFGEQVRQYATPTQQLFAYRRSYCSTQRDRKGSKSSQGALLTRFCSNREWWACSSYQATLPIYQLQAFQDPKSLFLSPYFFSESEEVLYLAAEAATRS